MLGPAGSLSADEGHLVATAGRVGSQLLGSASADGAAGAGRGLAPVLREVAAAGVVVPVWALLVAGWLTGFVLAALQEAATATEWCKQFVPCQQIGCHPVVRAVGATASSTNSMACCITYVDVGVCWQGATALVTQLCPCYC